MQGGLLAASEQSESKGAPQSPTRGDRIRRVGYCPPKPLKGRQKTNESPERTHMAWNKDLDKTLTKSLLSRSHRLKPMAFVGQAGLTEAVIGQVRRIFKTHDLVKVRVELDDRTEVQSAAEQLAAATDSTLVNRIGKVALLYRPIEEEEEEPAS